MAVAKTQMKTAHHVKDMNLAEKGHGRTGQCDIHRAAAITESSTHHATHTKRITRAD